MHAHSQFAKINKLWLRFHEKEKEEQAQQQKRARSLPPAVVKYPKEHNDHSGCTGRGVH